MVRDAVAVVVIVLTIRDAVVVVIVVQVVRDAVAVASTASRWSGMPVVEERQARSGRVLPSWRVTAEQVVVCEVERCGV